MKTLSLGFRKPFAGRRMVKLGEIGLLLFAAIGWWAGSASAAVLNVGDCVKPETYSTISAAISAANAGDTVSVCPGTYQEILTISKNLTIVGKSTSNTAVLEYPSHYQCPNSLPNEWCPQVLVESHATAQIERLTIDGSGFSADCTYHFPIGVLFFDASGGALYNTIENQNPTCEYGSPDGIGILGQQGDLGKYNVVAQGNYVENFYDDGIEMNNVTGNVLNNSISIGVEDSKGIDFVLSTGSSALNNTIWGTGVGDLQTGIYVNSSSKTAVTRNSITNIYNGIETDFSNTSNLNGNSSTDAQRGIVLCGASNNLLISNKVTGDPSTSGAVGVNIYDICGASLSNLLNGNSFNTLCSGVLTGGSDNIPITFLNNTFTNIGPGANIMSGNNCP